MVKKVTFSTNHKIITFDKNNTESHLICHIQKNDTNDTDNTYFTTLLLNVFVGFICFIVMALLIFVSIFNIIKNKN